MQHLALLVLLPTPAALPPQSEDGPPTWTVSSAAVLTQPAPNSTVSRIAIDGDTAAVGVGSKDTVYVFERDQGGPGAWGEVAQLVANDPTADSFGGSVAIFGDTLVVGAAGDTLGTGFHGYVEGLAYDPVNDVLYGTNIDGDELLSIDPATGLGTPIGPLGFNRVYGLAYDPGTGTLYGTDVAVDELLDIDTSTGAATVIGSLGPSFVEGLAFDPGSNTLFGTDTNSSQLVAIDPLTANKTAIGPLAWSNLRGLAFDAGAGVLYATDVQGDQLVTLDPLTGSGAVVGPLGLLRANALAFDPGSGFLYGSELPPQSCMNACPIKLARIDPSTGASVIVGQVYVGGPDAGSAFVFERDQGGPGAWGQVTKLSAPDALPLDVFGSAVAIHGDLIVVGAPSYDNFSPPPGKAYVYERDLGGPDAWGEKLRLTPSDGTGTANFGSSIDMTGDTIAIGAPTSFGGKEHGAYVLERDAGGPGNWGEVVKLVPSTTGTIPTRYAESLAVDGDTIVTGWIYALGVGGAFVYGRDVGGPSAWGEVTILTPADLQPGDFYGFSVALEGELALIGSLFDVHAPGVQGSSATGEGSAYLFHRPAGPAGTWSEHSKLVSPNPVAVGRYGAHAAFSNPTFVVGARYFGHVHELSHEAGNYCTAGTSANGCQALLSSVGTASATAASGFDLVASTVEGQRDGLFFFGANGRQANSWGSGTSFQCVVPPVVRGGLLTGSGTSGACDGAMTQDLNALWCSTCPKPAKNPGSGAIVQAQLWYRDPQNTSNQTTSLSDALEFFVSP